jgi:4-hydroxythreonine-4-phosphate dehydrogenase
MKKLAITMGDPGGIGPEIIVKALYSYDFKNYCVPIIIGDVNVIEEMLDLLKLPVKLRIIKSPEESKPTKNSIDIINVIVKEGKGNFTFKEFKKNKPSAEGGRACVSYIVKAAELALNKQIHGIVTAPISKEALKMAGFKWPGHTEMLAYLTKTKDYAMMLIGGPLRIILVTIHAALKNVPDLITKQKVFRTICLAEKACDMLKIKNPKITVAGLNPHAGEAGIFGDEEIKKIIPAINEAKKDGIPVSGPYPPDTVFYKAYRGDVDIIVCMYHDQGLIPLKMIAFESGVNVTVGLPFIRTSPDHGTAHDIAWKGIANPSSMIEAIKLAARLKI